MTSTADTPPAFYVRLGDGAFRATAAAQGPWDPRLQHGGPPAALLASVIEEHTGRPELRVARVTVDFYGPVPLGVLDVSVKVLRPGRRIQLAEAELRHDGRVVAVARTWQHAVAPAAAGDGVGEGRPLPPPLPAGEDRASALFASFGYGRALEWRTTAGAPDRLGPGAVWARPRIPLIDGTPMTGLQRALVVADSANGVSLSLPLDRFLSVPTSLDVALLRHPAGPWVHMAARTDFSGDGIGLSTAELADPAGPLGTVTQPLLIATRDA